MHKHKYTAQPISEDLRHYIKIPSEALMIWEIKEVRKVKKYWLVVSRRLVYEEEQLYYKHLRARRVQTCPT